MRFYSDLGTPDSLTIICKVELERQLILLFLRLLGKERAALRRQREFPVLMFLFQRNSRHIFTITIHKRIFSSAQSQK